MKSKKSCWPSKRTINFAFLFACILSYPINYMSMKHGWGFYEKNPQPLTEEVVSKRLLYLAVSPLAVPLNVAYSVAESTSE